MLSNLTIFGRLYQNVEHVGGGGGIQMWKVDCVLEVIFFFKLGFKYCVKWKILW